MFGRAAVEVHKFHQAISIVFTILSIFFFGLAVLSFFSGKLFKYLLNKNRLLLRQRELMLEIVNYFNQSINAGKQLMAGINPEQLQKEDREEAIPGRTGGIDTSGLTL